MYFQHIIEMMDTQDRNGDTYADRMRKAAAREQHARNARIGMAAASGYVSHEAGIAGSLHPSHRIGSINAGRDPITGKFVISNETGAGGHTSGSRSGGATSHALSDVVIGTLAVVAVTGGLIFTMKAINENFDFRPAVKFTYATNIENEDYSQFRQVCRLNQGTRLLSHPDDHRLNSFLKVSNNTIVGNLTPNTNATMARIAIKTDANIFEVFFGTKAQYRHGYVPSDFLKDCQTVTNFDPANAYQTNTSQGNRNKGSRGRRVSTNTETAPTQTASTCTTARLNVRQTPSKNGTVIATLPFQTAVQVKGEKRNQDWHLLTAEYGNQTITGYSHSAYVKPCP